MVRQSWRRVGGALGLCPLVGMNQCWETVPADASSNCAALPAWTLGRCASVRCKVPPPRLWSPDVGPRRERPGSIDRPGLSVPNRNKVGAGPGQLNSYTLPALTGMILGKLVIFFRLCPFNSLSGGSWVDRSLELSGVGK